MNALEGAGTGTGRTRTILSAFGLLAVPETGATPTTLV